MWHKYEEEKQKLQKKEYDPRDYEKEIKKILRKIEVKNAPIKFFSSNAG